MNCIYQMWDGPMPQGEAAGSVDMFQYANRIGAKYRFDLNERYFPKLPASYGRFRVLHDLAFDAYASVAYMDTDVWPVDNLQENIFEGFTADLALCTEPMQPAFRQDSTHGICSAADEAWAKLIHKIYGATMPRDEQGRLKVYNGGLQLWSYEGRRKARERFVSFEDYRRAMLGRGLSKFYALDQNYLHAMMIFAGLNWAELDNDWNRYVHYHPHPQISDQRTPTTKMVHVQLRGAGAYDGDKLRRIVNRPQEEWNL